MIVGVYEFFVVPGQAVYGSSGSIRSVQVDSRCAVLYGVPAVPSCRVVPHPTLINTVSNVVSGSGAVVSAEYLLKVRVPWWIRRLSRFVFLGQENNTLEIVQRTKVTSVALIKTLDLGNSAIIDY